MVEHVPIAGAKANTAGKTRGRPRRLQLDQVLEAALVVGLNQLTMAAVAERLGVGKAVLYGYVADRAELVRLATAHTLRQHRFPDDEGQAWSVWILEYACALFEVLTMDGGLLEAWLGGSQSTLVEVDTAESWLAALTKRGFTGEQALQLRRSVSHIVIGAAAAHKRDRTLNLQGRPRSASISKAVLDRPAAETPLLRQFLDIFGREVTDTNWEFTLYLLLRGVLAEPDALKIVAEDTSLPFAMLPAVSFSDREVEKD